MSLAFGDMGLQDGHLNRAISYLYDYPSVMPRGLIRDQGNGDFHFITFSCLDRKPYLHSLKARILFEEALERTRQKYRFKIFAYVVMPEHVHLLISEQEKGSLPDAMKMLKLAVSSRSTKVNFWTPRYYDFNVFTEKKRIEKLQYIHWNPVVRGLVAVPEEWETSSFRHWISGMHGRVEVESQWLASRRERALCKPMSPNARDMGHPVVAELAE